MVSISKSTLYFIIIVLWLAKYDRSPNKIFYVSVKFSKHASKWILSINLKLLRF
jgi:hypothetical protein